MMNCLLAICLAAGTFTVTDGDTLRSGDMRLRIHGIDAPEMDTIAGKRARAAMIDLTHGQPIACEDMGSGGWGRTAARCYLRDGTDLACAMVALGHAVDWPRYSGGLYARCYKGEQA